MCHCEISNTSSINQALSMADNVQTYILRVNIGCCNACPKTLKKMLLKNKCVENFDVDQEKSIVSVTGKVDLYKLIKDIKKKIKKNAEVIKKESSDSEKKQSSEEESGDSENKQPSEKSQEQMAPPEHFSENNFSRDELHAGLQNMKNCPCPQHMLMPQQYPGYYYPGMMASQPPPYGYYGHPYY